MFRCSEYLPDDRWHPIVTSLNLSGREAEILRGLLDDEPEATIAQRLRISAHTVHTHLERLYRKLAVNSRCQAVARVFAEYVRLNERVGG